MSASLRGSMTLAAVLFCLCIQWLHTTAQAQHVHTTPFEIGDEVKIECRRNLTAFPQAFTNRLPPRSAPAPLPPGHTAPPFVDDTDTWGPGIVCAETAKELSFSFGNDGFVYCGWFLANEDTYQFARSVMSQDSGWNCRVPMSKDRSFYLPIVIPLWGVVEPTHVHVNYHMNFVFHVNDGRIIGASVYPVRDRFQFGRVGSMINLHGPVKWFTNNGFTPLIGGAQGDSAGSGEGVGFLGVMLWCFFCMAVTLTLSALFYVFRLKPMLVKRYLKGD